MGVLHEDVIKWKHCPRYWPFVRGIHRSPVNSPHKGQWCVALVFSLICGRINGWVNNGEAGDLRRHRAHYDVTVMDRRKLRITFRIYWELFILSLYVIKIKLVTWEIKQKHVTSSWTRDRDVINCVMLSICTPNYIGWRIDLGPYHERFSIVIQIQWKINSRYHIAKQNCTCYDSTFVVTCTKFHWDHVNTISMGADGNFHRI